MWSGPCTESSKIAPRWLGKRKPSVYCQNGKLSLRTSASTDSPKSFPTGGNEEKPGLSHDPSQGEIQGGSGSHSCHDVAEAIEMIAPENSTSPVEPEKKHFTGGAPQSADERSSELPDPTIPARANGTELLYEVLTSSSTDQQPKADMWHNFARDILTLYLKNLKKYKTCVRSKVTNLKNPPQNSHDKACSLGPCRRENLPKRLSWKWHTRT